MSILFVGISGSGKSHVAENVARIAGMDFLDTDRLIERREGTSVEKIFQTKGERHFRKVEKEVVLESCRREGACIALGGGAVTIPEVRECLKKNRLCGSG